MRFVAKPVFFAVRDDPIDFRFVTCGTIASRLRVCYSSSVDTCPSLLCVTRYLASIVRPCIRNEAMTILIVVFVATTHMTVRYKQFPMIHNEHDFPVLGQHCRVELLTNASASFSQYWVLMVRSLVR